MIRKQPVTTHLDPSLILLIDRFGAKNGVSRTIALEMILRVFFNEDDHIDKLVFEDSLKGQIDSIERKLLMVERVSQCHVEAIEKLEEKIATLEEAEEMDTLSFRVEMLENVMDKLGEDELQGTDG